MKKEQIKILNRGDKVKYQGKEYIFFDISMTDDECLVITNGQGEYLSISHGAVEIIKITRIR